MTLVTALMALMLSSFQGKQHFAARRPGTNAFGPICHPTPKALTNR